jgi:hypothetical protein
VQPAPDPSTEKHFIYPREGQSEKQQAEDQYQCHRWAVEKTGFDPTTVKPGEQEGQSQANRLSNDYWNAMSTCLDALGYTVK